MICDQLKVCVEKQLAGESLKKCKNKTSKCVDSADQRSKVACGEKSKKYVLDNTQKRTVLSYKMDGGIIVMDKTVPPETQKCDYLYVIEEEKPEVILIELKGTDVAHSLKQMDGTLEQFRDFFEGMSHVYGRVVVTSFAPKLLADPSYANLKKKLKRYNGNLKIRERQLLEKDTELKNG